MKKRGAMMLGVMGATAAAVAIQWPEIQRYLKVRKM
jgi:uncharacterized protein DUF6893